MLLISREFVEAGQKCMSNRSERLPTLGVEEVWLEADQN
jgi:hypothetical protein